MNGAGVEPPATVPLPPGTVALEPVSAPLVRVKLAQLRRVVLLEWMTMDRLPKKLEGPCWVER